MSQYYFDKITQNVVYPLHVFEATSPRKVLFAINLILVLCMVVMATYSVYLTSLLFDPDFITGWTNWLILVIVSLFLIFASILGMRGAHLVSLELLLTYFWSIIVLIAPLLLGLFAVFNFSFYSRIWYKHQWSTENFYYVRLLFCSPSNTANNKCIAPLYDQFLNPVDDDIASGFNSTTTWCMALYNATDCTEIRDNAVDLAVSWGTILILANTIIGISSLVLMVFAIYISVEILTAPVITQSMLEISNYLLLIPIATAIGQTVGFWYISSLQIRYTWLPRLYLATVVAQVCVLPLGIYAGRMKSRGLLRSYMALVLMIIGAMATATTIGWTLATLVKVDFPVSRQTIYDIACNKDLPGCSGCSLSPRQCPEWSTEDVTTLMSLDFRLTGMVSALSILYLAGALIVGGLVDNSLANYKSDFV